MKVPNIIAVINYILYRLNDESQTFKYKQFKLIIINLIRRNKKDLLDNKESLKPFQI